MSTPSRSRRAPVAAPSWWTLAQRAATRPDRGRRRAPRPSGKTGLSLDLAERLGGEIVNTDAMQVYRGMDIGTAKLPPAERRGIPHHLLDLLAVPRPGHGRGVPGRARAAIAELRAARRPPVLVGGSALYTRAILDRFEFPGHRRRGPARGSRPSSPQRRAGAPCTSGCATCDPEAAARILARERPPHRAGPGGRRDHRPALQRQPPDARVRRPAHRPDRRRHRPPDPRRADRAAGGPRCSTAASSTRSSGCSTPGWPRAAPPRRAIGYREVAAYLAASSPWPRRASRPSPRPAGSRAARTRGSARTRASSGCAPTTPARGPRARGRPGGRSG